MTSRSQFLGNGANRWSHRWLKSLLRHGRFAICTGIGISLAGFSGGCAARSAGALIEQYRYDKYTEHVFQNTEYPDTALPTSDYPDSTPSPRTLDSKLPEREADYWNLTLDEAIHQGLENSRVLNDLGGTILRSPETVQTNLNPIVNQTDPRYGVEAALSAFDARYNFSANYEKNDRIYNNLFLSGGQAGRFFQQDLNVYKNEIVKQSATGGQYAVRHFLEYDANTAPSNLYGSAYTTWFEGEARQSLLQGAGSQFNRIAGPGATPGNYRGVMIARVNADMSQADFEIALRDYLSNVENAYWDLHNAYRELDGRIRLRDMALEVYEAFKVRAANGDPGFEEFRLDQLREQYYRFENDVQTALSGRLIDGTRTNNGSTGGTFRNSTGVYLAERRLRLLLGIPATDGRLIRPEDDPCLAETSLDWDLVRTEALQRRPELMKQRLKIKRSELELTASKNFLLPKLDAVGRYRFRGFGHGMFDGNAGDLYSSAFGNLGSGDFQEWQLGVEMSVPIGYRQAYAAVSNAEFILARDRALLREQERQIVHNAGNAYAELTRTFEATRTTYDRRAAAEKYLEGLAQTRNLDRGESRLLLEQLLESQRRFAEADSQYNAAVVEYQLAIKNVNIEKGTLLDFYNMLPVDGTLTEKSDRKASTAIAAKDSWSRPAETPAIAGPSEAADESPTILKAGAVRLPVDGDQPADADEESFAMRRRPS